MFEKEIEELIDDHKAINKVLREFEKKLDNFTVLDAENLLNFVLIEVENHAIKEDEIFLPKVLKIYPNYDAESFSFAHLTIREEADYLKQTIKDVNLGNSKEDILKTYTKKLIKIIYDHFLEEENFFFPDIKRIKEKEGKYIMEEIDLKEEKEWL